MALGDLKPLLAALALHGLLGVVLGALVPPPAAALGRWLHDAPAAQAEIAVALEWDLAVPPPSGLLRQSSPSVKRDSTRDDLGTGVTGQRPAGRSEAIAGLRLGPTGPSDPAEIAPGQPAGSGEDSLAIDEGSYGQLPSVAGLIPGLGGPALWALPGAMPPVGPGAPAPTAAPPRTIDPQAANRALRAAVRRSDKRKGLGLQAATTVVSVLREAVRRYTPPVSLATFQARLDGAGRLVDVRVLSFSAGTVQMWRRAAGQTRARLAARSFAMPADFASGALITVHVQSEIQWPSGTGRAKPVTKRKIEAPWWPYTPRPPPEGYSSRTPPWGPPPKDGVVARFDASDIGAHPTRVVYVRVDAQPL